MARCKVGKPAQPQVVGGAETLEPLTDARVLELWQQTMNELAQGFFDKGPLDNGRPSLSIAFARKLLSTTPALESTTPHSEAQAGETPRTDALLLKINEGRVYKDNGPETDLCRQLERELQAANKYAEAYKEEHVAIVQELGKKLSAANERAERAEKLTAAIGRDLNETANERNDLRDQLAAQQAAPGSLGNLIIETHTTLSWGFADGCRCMCCREFQLRDCDDKLIASGETLEELLRTTTQGQSE